MLGVIARSICLVACASLSVCFIVLLSCELSPALELRANQAALELRDNARQTSRGRCTAAWSSARPRLPVLGAIAHPPRAVLRYGVISMCFARAQTRGEARVTHLSLSSSATRQAVAKLARAMASLLTSMQEATGWLQNTSERPWAGQSRSRPGPLLSRSTSTYNSICLLGE